MVEVAVGDITFHNREPFALIAGPCVMESTEHTIRMATSIRDIAAQYDIPFVFKGSFDKANRTRVDSPRGLGIDAGLRVLRHLREQYGIAVTTDVHAPGQCVWVAGAVDLIQIPAFLCRQTDLIEAAAATGLPVNVKKGQFLAPWDMRHVVDKVVGAGNPNVLITERGVSFGYNTLVSDMRALPVLPATGAPVIFDATH